MARIGAPFGIKGWLKLHTFTEAPDSLDQYASWLVRVNDAWQEFELEDFDVNAKGAIAKFRGIDDRTAAERLVKRDIGIPRADLIAEDDDVLWLDLIGSEVVNAQGKVFGIVESLMETGANDVLVVKGFGAQTLIPYIDAVIVEFDREKKRLTVDWSGEYQ
jgi:16S rRNA processing protein RimM